MSDTTRDLLVRGIAAAKSGEMREAQFYLDWLLRLEPSMEERKEAWFWLSKASVSSAEKRKYLEEILVNDLWDSRARRELAILDGKLKESDIVDPDRLAPQQPGEETARADRFTCPQCGGRMTFTPSGQSLTCEYCDSQQRRTLKQQVPAEADGADFIIGLATARGHLRPATVHTIMCSGCGATMILPPHQISQNCPFCQSSYVLSQQATAESIVPDRVIPFQVSEAQMKLALRGWFAQQKFEQPPRVARAQGVYLPAWLFNLGGHVQARYQLQTGREEWTDMDDSIPVLLQDVLVAGTRRFSEAVIPVFQSFDLDGLVPFDQAYLADWLAETYQVTMSDASLDARQQAFSMEKERFIYGLPGSYRALRFSSAGMQIESYQFALLPVWVTAYKVGQSTHTIAVNGQNGKVFAEKPGPDGWLAKLLGG